MSELISKTDEYWKYFLTRRKLDANLKHCGEIAFGEDAESSEIFIAAIMDGICSASFRPVESFEIDMTPIPQVGNFYVMVDFAENPIGILQTQMIKVMPFKDITWDIAQKEGIADSIEEWREIKKDAFAEDADFMGYNFSEETPILFEQFSVVFSKKQQSE